MSKTGIVFEQAMQPKEYSAAELAKLKEFVETVQKDDARAALACWGDHNDYFHGY